jgi:hypothetical protein
MCHPQVFLSGPDQLLFTLVESFLLQSVLLLLSIEVSQHFGGFFFGLNHLLFGEGRSGEGGGLLLGGGVVVDRAGTDLRYPALLGVGLLGQQDLPGVVLLGDCMWVWIALGYTLS